MADTPLKRFLFPEINRRYCLRLLIVGLAAFILFKYILIPFRIEGRSMWPTYTDGSFNFCFGPAFLFSAPAVGDVVTIRLAGKQVMLLKRVVATEHQVVSFKDGQLYVDQKKVKEPYAAGPCDWELPSRRVKEDHVYVVGDNRSVPLERHHFGQTPVERIVGVPLW